MKDLANSRSAKSPHIQRDAHKPEAAVDSGVDEELLCEVGGGELASCWQATRVGSWVLGG